MKYPVQRYLETNLHVTTATFYAETRWQAEAIVQWDQAHLPVSELPIALLMDLATYSQPAADIQSALETLQRYQEEYLHEVAKQRNYFCRIPNNNQLLQDLNAHQFFDDSNRLLQTITQILDESVYEDPFTVAADWDQQDIAYVSPHEASQPTILYHFKVKLFQLATGEAYPIYHYQGPEVKQPDYQRLMQ